MPSYKYNYNDYTDTAIVNAQEVSLWKYFTQATFCNVFNYRGRASRKEYWGIYLFYGLIIFFTNYATNYYINKPFSFIANFIDWIFYTFFFWGVDLPCGVRRLHDLNLDASWWIALNSVSYGMYLGGLFFSSAEEHEYILFSILAVMISLPVAGAEIVIGCIKGCNGPNRFGEDSTKTFVCKKTKEWIKIPILACFIFLARANFKYFTALF